MEQTQYARQEAYLEFEELLDTAAFSLETARMALSIGRHARETFRSLEDRIRRGDHEEREASVVALEALDNARGAYLDLAEVFDEEPYCILGYQLRFWSTFEWIWNRLFTESVRRTGQVALRQELVEASHRTRAIQDALVAARMADAV